jgi:phosphoribosylaminoimidazole-succinocarboxamide synthase
MDDAFVHSVTDRYVELFERITGSIFHPAPTGDINARVQRVVGEYLG